jgi:cytochrome b subunit of formate dehydrogenase
MKLISRIDRISAWVLLACILMYILSGFDIQRHFLSPALSSSLHLVYIFPVAQIAFAFHTSYAMQMAFKRWNFWNALGKGVLVLYLLLNVFFLGLYADIQFFS